MHSICLLLVICLAACGQAIRVDWGTNTGPIVPPTPRTTPAPPREPYRAPAPVWEDQSNDIHNPNPYVYVLPPPSRPRTWIIPAGPYAPTNYNNQPPKRNYGALVNGSAAAPAGNVLTVPVAALAAQYVPGVGIKYTAIVPSKQQGKYNAKTKKYKAYEKAKYAPWNYLQLLPLEEQTLLWQADDSSPSSTTLAPSSSSSTSPTTTTTTNTTTTTTTTSATATNSTTQLPTDASSTIANYKLAHEKSAYLKKKKLSKLLAKMKLQAQNSLAKSS